VEDKHVELERNLQLCLATAVPQVRNVKEHYGGGGGAAVTDARGLHSTYLVHQT